MRGNQTIRWLRTFLLLGGSLLLFATGLCGCGDEGPSVTSPVPQAPAGPILLRNPSPQGTAMALEDRQASKALKADEAAELTVGHLKVQIPEFALSNPATITLTLVDPELLLFRVEPADLVLKKSLKVTLTNIDETTADRLSRLRFAQKVGRSWRVISTQRSGMEICAYSRVAGDFGVGEANGREIEFIAWEGSAGSTTQLVSARQGGVVEYGRYRLTIPPGALRSDTPITVTDPGAEYLMCELEPHGYQFLVPVTLEIDVAGTSYLPHLDWTIWWLDETSGSWVDQGGGLANERVCAELWHFSEYTSGRAGW